MNELHYLSAIFNFFLSYLNFSMHCKKSRLTWLMEGDVNFNFFME